MGRNSFQSWSNLHPITPWEKQRALKAFSDTRPICSPYANSCRALWGGLQTAIWSELWFDPTQSRMHRHPSFVRSFATATTKVTHQCPMQYHNVPGIHRWTMKGFRDLVLFADNDWGTLLCVSFLGSQCVVDSHIVMVISCATSAMHIHFLGVFPPCQWPALHTASTSGIWHLPSILQWREVSNDFQMMWPKNED